METRQGVRANVVLIATLLTYLLISTAYNLAVPVGEAPDEPSHIDYVEIFLRSGQLPTIPKGSARYSYEAEQPPLYYSLQAAWMAILWPNSIFLPHLEANPDFSFAKETPYNLYLHNYPQADTLPVHLMRLLSTLVGLCTLLLIWLTARELWPAESGPALVALGFAAMLPGFTFTAGTVTNDILAACAGAGILYALVCCIRRGLDRHLVLVSGALLGLGILSKRSLLVFLPLLLLAFALSPSRDNRTRLTSFAAALCATIILGVWPFASNVVAYGDPLATAVTHAAKGDLGSPLASIPFFWLDRGYVGGLLDSLWGAFGLRNLELPGPIYVVYYALFLVGVIVPILYLRRTSSTERRVILLLGVALVLVYAGVAYQNSQFWAVQGRLLLPALAALALLIGHGLSTLFGSILRTPRAKQVMVAVVLSILAALNVYALLGRLIPAYYG